MLAGLKISFIFLEVLTCVEAKTILRIYYRVVSAHVTSSTEDRRSIPYVFHKYDFDVSGNGKEKAKNRFEFAENIFPSKQDS